MPGHLRRYLVDVTTGDRETALLVFVTAEHDFLSVTVEQHRCLWVEEQVLPSLGDVLVGFPLAAVQALVRPVDGPDAFPDMHKLFGPW